MSKAYGKLFTTLVHAKQELRNGSLPPMTPIGLGARAVLDPSFTLGIGGLNEREDEGLQCPVKGCGVWRHKLGLHLNTTHAEIGGAVEIKRLLDIPAPVRLVSQRYRQKCTAMWNERVARGWTPGVHGSAALQRSRVRRVPAEQASANRATYRSMGFRNLRDQCEAQIAHKLIDLHHKLGRSPSGPEARAEYGYAFVQACVRLYGTWNNAKAQQGLETFNKGQRFGRERVLNALQAWYDVHGKLPSSGETRKPKRAPLIPGDSVIMKALKVRSYHEAMEIARIELGLVQYADNRRAA